jgi:hypothetical protein
VDTSNINDQIQLVKTKRDKAIREANISIAAGKEDDLKRAIETIESCDILIKSLHINNTKKIFSMLKIGLITIGIILILSAIPCCNTSTIIELKAKLVSMQLADDWSALESVKLNNVSSIIIEGMNEISSKEFRENIVSENGDTWLLINKGDVSLSDLKVNKGANIEIEAPDKLKSLTELSFNDSKMSGELLISGTPVIDGASWQEESNEGKTLFQAPKIVKFSFDGTGAAPASIKIRPEDEYELPEFNVNKIGFKKETGVVSQESVSTIISGIITIQEINKTIDVRRNDIVSILVKEENDSTKNSQSIVKMDIHPELGDISFSFEGTAKDIKLGHGKFEQSLKPSLLEYLYHQKSFGLFWGAFIYLWGVLLWMKKAFVK